MIVAVAGCIHGQLDLLYSQILSYQKHHQQKVDVLLCCGDFQANRHQQDLKLLKCPQKYKKIGDFKRYFNGQKMAPVLTLFIGGNHQAVAYSRQLLFGGWVAPNIYYLGSCNFLQVVKESHSISIAGLSGIFNFKSFQRTCLQQIPFDDSSRISAYHTNQLDAIRLLALSQLNIKPDIMLSHDWPASIQHSGMIFELLQRKPFFKDDIQNGRLGNPILKQLLQSLSPNYWFAAHMHVKYPAIYNSLKGKIKYLALDKCVKGRQFLQIIQIPTKPSKIIKKGIGIEFRDEWLQIMKFSFDYMKKYPSLMSMGKKILITKQGQNVLNQILNFVKSNKRQQRFQVPDFSRIQGIYNFNKQTQQYCKAISKSILQLKGYVYIYDYKDENQKKIKK